MDVVEYPCAEFLLNMLDELGDGRVLVAGWFYVDAEIGRLRAIEI